MYSLLKMLLLLAVAMACATSSLAQVYKWVDEDGNVHYSDEPPDDIEAERIYIDTSTPRQAPSANEKLLQDAEDRYQRLDEARASRAIDHQTKEQVQLERDQLCANHRKQLISLQQKLPVYLDEEGKFRTLSEYDAYEGKREYLDDATRAREIERVVGEIATACDNPLDRKEQFVAGWERKLEKRCESARLDLAKAQRDKRAPRQTVEDAQAEVDRHCIADK